MGPAGCRYKDVAVARFALDASAGDPFWVERDVRREWGIEACRYVRHLDSRVPHPRALVASRSARSFESHEHRAVLRST